VKIKLLLLSVLTVCHGAYSQVLLYDDFSGTSIDLNLWAVGLPENDASVTEGSGYVALENAGRITTQQAMQGNYAVSGRFLMANNQFSNFKVVLRSDGTTYNGSRESAGIAFMFNIQDDPAGGGSTTHNLGIFSIGNPAGDFYTPSATASLTLNTWHTFRITDDGYNLDLYFDGSASPALSAQSSFSAGDLGTFYNREGAAAGSSISANGITKLDYVQISNVPEPSPLAMFGVGLFGFIAFRKRYHVVSSSSHS
jgi:hypothetical protein